MNAWYQQTAPQQDVVLSTRIRLARNVASLPFGSRLSRDQREQLDTQVQQALETIHLGDNSLSFLRLDDMDPVERQALVEQHEISPDFAKNPDGRLLVLSQDGSISIMVNEEDHLRIQVLHSGLALKEAYELCNRLDDVLDSQLGFAFDRKLGYLTACPTNLGTGLRASVMLHLPGLQQQKMISRLADTVGKLGLTIRGTYGEGSGVVGAVYQLSNQITLGITEKDAMENLENVTAQIIQSEEQARKALAQNQTALEDKLWRSYGVLKNARLLSSEECQQTLSWVRMGVAMKLLPPIPYSTLNQLLLTTGSASVCKNEGQLLRPEDRDRVRAGYVRKVLQEN